MNCRKDLEECEKPKLKLHGFFHPLILEPVRNNMEVCDNKNLYFISGTNMLGKSTFLKTVGLCMFLAHVGFPVPAESMVASQFNGIYTTINISDDLNKGYSHYYSEVKRVKDIALMIKERKRFL